jgi:hypothetical protein
MWILTKYGFYSIIEAADDARYLIVRAGRRITARRAAGGWPKSEIARRAEGHKVKRALFP